MYKLFLDDERYPAECDRDAFIVRSCEEAVDHVLKYGFPSEVLLDHDLGDSVPTGHDFVKFLVDYCIRMNYDPQSIKFSVHSMNPVGKRNMEQLWQGFLLHWETSRGEK